MRRRLLGADDQHAQRPCLRLTRRRPLAPVRRPPASDAGAGCGLRLRDDANVAVPSRPARASTAQDRGRETLDSMNIGPFRVRGGLPQRAAGAWNRFERPVLLRAMRGSSINSQAPNPKRHASPNPKAIPDPQPTACRFTPLCRSCRWDLEVWELGIGAWDLISDTCTPLPRGRRSRAAAARWPPPTRTRAGTAPASGWPTWPGGQLLRVLEIVAAQPDHVAPRDRVAGGRDVDQADLGAAGLRVGQLGEGDRDEVAALQRDHRPAAAGEHVLRGAIAEVPRVLHVHRDRIGAAQLVADVLRGDRRS